MPANDDDSNRPQSRAIKPSGRSGDVVPSRPRRRAEDDELDELPSAADIERFSNVTRTCPECKKEVFDDAAVCYHCGYAFERTTAGSSKSKPWVIVVVVLLVLAFALFALRGLL